jgi:F-type H+-transporting ATPase subunit delta
MAEHDLRAAKRYATALFNHATKQKQVDAVERDLDTVIDMMRLSPDLRRTWESPLLAGQRKAQIMEKVLADSVGEITLSFLRLLITKRREEILPAVRTEMRNLADRARRLLRVEATFAIPPTAEEQAGLARSLESRTGERVVLAYHIDPSILGGVVVRMRDTIIDGSVRGALERMRDQLLQEA